MKRCKKERCPKCDRRLEYNGGSGKWECKSCVIEAVLTGEIDLLKRRARKRERMKAGIYELNYKPAPPDL